MLDTILENPFAYGSVSFGLLVFASWCVGEGGEILGEKYDASIVGGLIIAWLNTTPETIFFIAALQSSNPRFAVGAVSGSTIVVCTIALGAILYIGSRARRHQGFRLQPAIKQQALILAATSVIPLMLALFGFNALLSIVGIGSYLAFIIYSFICKPKSESEQKKVDLEAPNGPAGDEESDSEEEGHGEAPLSKGIAFLVVGGLLIFLFSEPFISAVVAISERVHVNPILLAFFLAPIASEMPEILESVSLSRKGKENSINIAFSNLIGGTITKTTLLCGILSFYGVTNGFTWEMPNYTISMVLILCSAVSAGFIGWYYNRLTQHHGVFLFALFALTGFLQYYYNSTFSSADTAQTQQHTSL